MSVAERLQHIRLCELVHGSPESIAIRVGLADESDQGLHEPPREPLQCLSCLFRWQITGTVAELAYIGLTRGDPAVEVDAVTPHAWIRRGDVDRRLDAVAGCQVFRCPVSGHDPI